MQNPNGPIGKRTRDLTACSAVPQPTGRTSHRTVTAAYTETTERQPVDGGDDGSQAFRPSD
jgi:hypothetical protein